MNQLITDRPKKFSTILLILLGLCLAILAVGGARPNLPVYEVRYLIALMTLVLTASALINERLRNPYVDILHIVFLFFYVVRAIALLIYPLSTDLSGTPLPISAVSNSTVFLILAFISLVVGCHLFLRRPLVELRSLNPLETSVVRVALWISTVLVLVNGYYYITTFMQCNINVYAGISNSALAILHHVFDLWRALILLIPAIVLYGGLLSNSERLVAICNLVLIAAVGVFTGSKSSILLIILYFLFPMVMKLRSSEVLKLRGLIIPFVLLTALVGAGFMGGKAMRIIHINDTCTTDSSKIEMAVYFRALLRGQVDPETGVVKYFLNPDKGAILQLTDNFSYRTGYFDFFVEKFSNPAYLDVVTLKRYSMAITDKLTPGFDVFNVPFVSRSIYYAHHPGSVPGSMTNSEQLTVFGEAGLLFGWGALLFLPFFCWLLGGLHRILHRLAGDSMLAKNLVFLFMLQLFYYWIEGMGLDMLLVLHLLHSGIFILCVGFLAWGTVAASRLRLKQ